MNEIEKKTKDEMQKSIDGLKARAVDLFPLGMNSSYLEGTKIKCDGNFVILRSVATVKLISNNVFFVEPFVEGYMKFLEASLSTKGSVISEKTGIKLILPALHDAEKQRIIKEFKSESERFREMIRSTRQKLRKDHCSSKKKSDEEAANEKLIENTFKKFDDEITKIYEDFAKRVQKI